MELATALFGSLFGGGAAAGAAAGAAGATGAAVGGSMLFKALAIGGGVLGAIAQIGAGQAERDQAYAQAKQEDFESRNEYIEGREAAAQLKRRLLETVSGQATAFARGGVSLSSVSVQTAKAQATEDAERELSVNSSTALAREIQRRRRATNLRLQGDNAASSATIGAFGSLLSTGMKLAEVG